MWIKYSKIQKVQESIDITDKKHFFLNKENLFIGSRDMAQLLKIFTLAEDLGLSQVVHTEAHNP